MLSMLQKNKKIIKFYNNQLEPKISIQNLKYMKSPKNTSDSNNFFINLRQLLGAIQFPSALLTNPGAQMQLGVLHIGTHPKTF